jgi:poly(3-hydroxybutyrate) depolymerase
MNQARALLALARAAAVVACLQLVATHAALAQAAAPAAAPSPATGPAPQPVDPRVQIRSYRFEATGAEIPYALFVSSKVRRDAPSPLVVALHGLCGSHTSLLRGNALDLAEQGGFILVGPMGYNPRGWYGVPQGTRRPPPAPNSNAAPQPRPRPASCGEGEDPPNLRELSEQDVLNVVDLINEELSVDARRTYLMGHSMGGAGAFHLGVKYPEKWAALAAIAPAAFSLDPASIATVPSMPVIVVHGDKDTAVPVSLSRTWVDVMKQHDMTHEYREIADGDHGNVIGIGMPDIFAFFEAHAKPRRRDRNRD